MAEHSADARADRLDGDDDKHRNKARDKRIFDRRHTGFIVDKVTDSKHGILLTLYGSLRSQAAAVSKPSLSKRPQDPDHDAKSHPPIANGSTGGLKFYRLRAKGRNCSLILNQMTLGALESRTIIDWR
jgi:hypothetical protein